MAYLGIKVRVSGGAPCRRERESNKRPSIVSFMEERFAVPRHMLVKVGSIAPEDAEQIILSRKEVTHQCYLVTMLAQHFGRDLGA